MRECIECSEEYAPVRSAQRFCSQACRNQWHTKRNNTPTYPITRTATGAASELVVCADLTLKGFEVFRAVAPDASCDLVILREGQMQRVQVKTDGRYVKTEHKPFAVLKEDGRYDIIAYVTRTSGIFYYEPDGKLIEL